MASGTRALLALGWAAIPWLLPLAQPVARAEGKLDRARREIDGSDSSSRHRGSRHDDDDDDDDDDDSFLGRLLWSIFFDDDDDDPHHHHHHHGDRVDDGGPEPGPAPTPHGFVRYPYRYDGAGYAVPLSLPPTVTGRPRAPGPAQRGARIMAATLSLSGGYGDGVVQAELDGRILLPSTFDLGLRLGTLYEPGAAAGAEPGETGIESATLGMLRMASRFVQTDVLLLRAGASLRVYDDAVETSGGLDVMLGLDLMPLQPLIFGLELAVGGMQEALLVEGRAHVGVNYRSVEIFGGCSYLAIGDVGFPAVILGTRIWL